MHAMIPLKERKIFWTPTEGKENKKDKEVDQTSTVLNNAKVMKMKGKYFIKMNSLWEEK